MRFSDYRLSLLYASLVLAADCGWAAASLQEMVDGAVSSGQKQVVIPPGEYRVSPAKKTAHLSFRKIRGLTVDAAGVRLICEKAISAVEIVDCKDLTIRGLTIDYDPVLNTQGTVEEIDLAAGTLTLKVDEGYPCTADYGVQIQTFDPATRLLKKGFLQINKAKTEVLPDRRLRITTENRVALKTLAVGDLVALDRTPEGPSHAISVKNSGHVAFEDVTLHGSPSFGVLESGGAGGHEYRRFRITPGPKPAGASTERLRSIADDGIHSSSSQKGPQIEDCLIERHGDDGIAIHGSYHLVVGVAGKTARLALKREAEFAVGDTLTFYNPDASHAGEAKVVSIGAARAATPDELETIKSTTWELVRPIFSNMAEIELDIEVTVPAGGRVVSRERCGNDFAIRNTTVRDHRARGILVKASNGVIENNTVDNSSIAGIVLAPEFSWMEADYSSNVKIIGNTVRNTGIDPANASRSQAGAISVCAEGLDGKLAPAGGHKNIVIVGNKVESCRGAGLVVTSAENVKITGNQFTDIDTGHFGSKHGIADRAVIWIDKVNDVTLENNTVPSDDGVVFGDGVTGNQSIK